MSRTKAPSQPETIPVKTAATTNSFDAWLTPGKMLFVLLGLMLVTFPDVFLQGKVFSYRDAGIFNYPSAYFVRESWLRGEAPLWNPYNNCGIPFLAQWNVMALYPLSAIYVLLPVPWSITIFSLGHLFLAAAGMYFLAQRWTNNRLAASVAGIAFAWNGITLHSMMWPNSCASIGWMPWVILLVESAMKKGGRTVLLAGVVGAMQMLAGVPEIILLTWVFAGGLSLLVLREERKQFIKVFVRGLVLGAIVVGLTAAQMLPFFDLLQHSHRSEGLKKETWALPIWGWANYIVPLFRSSPDDLGVYTQDEQQWSSSYYLGIALLGLSIVGIRNWRQPRVVLLIAFTALGGVFALGEQGLVYAWAQKVIPGLSIMRYPAKWTQLPMLCVPLLAAFGIAWIQSKSEDRPASPRRFLYFVTLGLLLVGGIILAVAHSRPRPDEPWQTVWANGFVRIVFLAVAIGVVANLFSRNPLFSRNGLMMILLALLGLDISFHMPRQVPTTPASEWGPIQYKMSELPKLGESRAMLSAPAQQILRKASARDPISDFSFKREAMHMDANLLDRIPKVNGLFSLYIKEAAEVDNEIYFKGEYSDGLFDFLGASQMSSPEDVTEWGPRANHLPLATAGAKPVFLESGEALARIFSPRFNARKNVFLPKNAEGVIKAAEANDQTGVMPASFSAREISWNVTAQNPTVMTIAQTFYHPWKAFVDGSETTIWRANHAYQAIEVPAGEHVVKLVYEDRMFRVGTYISLGTLGVVVLAWFLIRKKPLAIS